MQADLAGRIRLRLAELDINPFEAARRSGLERSFINDVLIGKKLTVREAGLAKLGLGLDCDPAYLTGHQETPRALAADTAQGMTVMGVCETGVWRSAGATVPATVAPLMADPRFPGVPNLALMARGDGGAAAGIGDGDYVVALDYRRWEEREGPVRDGQLCVVRRERIELQEAEVAVRRAFIRSGDVALAACSPRDMPAVSLLHQPGERVEIVGVIDRSVRLFL
jgi:SOS-response transcriptional repressor LexA